MDNHYRLNCPPKPNFLNRQFLILFLIDSIITLRIIFRKDTKEEIKRDNSTSHLHLCLKNQPKTSQNDSDLRCEEAIMKDKERFGRTRNSLMKHLRAEYGNDVADRALRRINKRRIEGYLNKRQKI